MVLLLVRSQLTGLMGKRTKEVAGGGGLLPKVRTGQVAVGIKTAKQCSELGKKKNPVKG